MGFGSAMMDTELGSRKKDWHGINIVLVKIFNNQL